MDAILTPVSIGELIDKITILEIKAERIGDVAKLATRRTQRDGQLPFLPHTRGGPDAKARGEG